MKNILILVIFFLTSCVPMELKIQQAIYKTQTIEVTIVPTSTLAPANTKTPVPTFTRNPMVTFETGLCFEYYENFDTPKGKNCQVGTSKIIDGRNLGSIVIDTDQGVPFAYMYCVIYTANGGIISANIESKGHDLLTCYP